MGAGLRAHNVFKKKYPLIISDERVSLSHLNLMTLAWWLVLIVNRKSAFCEESVLKNTPCILYGVGFVIRTAPAARSV